jgi:phosphoribosylglycinamide formyltransferase-1
VTRKPGRRPIVILISGSGSNMRALLEASLAPDAPFRVAEVLSDKIDAPGLDWARSHGIPAQGFATRQGDDRAAFDRELMATINAQAPVLVVLAGFMRILSTEFVEYYANRMLNIHPSLLPKYPGLHTHRRALEAHDAEHGATVHFVTAELDAGPRVLQARVSMEAQDTEAALAARVLAKEHLIYPLAVRWYCEDRLRCEDGQAWLDDRVLHEPVRYEALPGAQA